MKRGGGAKKIAVPEVLAREQFDNLLRHGPKGDVRGSLDRLRFLVLSDGLDADSDGMVGYYKSQLILRHLLIRHSLTIVSMCG